MSPGGHEKAPPRRGSAAGPDVRVPGPFTFMRAGHGKLSGPGRVGAGPVGSPVQSPSTGSSTNTGITRSVFSWYSAYGG